MENTTTLTHRNLPMYSPKGKPVMLVAYETSGTVRRAFEARGWDAYSCDLLPADDNSPQHFQMPIEELMKDTDFMSRVILVIAHPPCTYLCSSAYIGTNEFLDVRKRQSKRWKMYAG